MGYFCDPQTLQDIVIVLGYPLELDINVCWLGTMAQTWGRQISVNLK